MTTPERNNRERPAPGEVLSALVGIVEIVLVWLILLAAFAALLGAVWAALG